MARRMLSGESVPLVTVLPPSPADGQVIDYLADSVNGVLWRFRYRPASASGLKWEFVGGAPLVAQVDPDETTTSTTPAALATAGPSITLPLAGDYVIDLGCAGYNSTGTAWAQYFSYDIGATAAAPADGCVLGSNIPNVGLSHAARSRRKNGLGVVALTGKYWVSAGTGHFNSRWIEVLPVRVG